MKASVAQETQNLYIIYIYIYKLIVRIKFKKEENRISFFNSVKNKTGKSWKDLRTELKIPKASFDNYKSGKLLIPENIFLRLLDFLNSEDKDTFIKVIEKMHDNFGQIIGGKSAYKINFKKFQEGRLKGLNKITKNKYKEKIIFNLKLTPEICEFIGAYIGDGTFNVYKNKTYRVEFAGDKRYDLQYYNNKIIPAIRTIDPDIEPHFYNSYLKENAVRIVFYSKRLFTFLKDFIGFPPGKKTFTISIPEKIIKSNNPILIYSTIRGIFDTDGGVFIDKRSKYKKPYPRIFLQTVSKPLYEQLVYYLSKEFKLYTRFNPIRNIYIIEIYTINQVKKWMSLIGFSNTRHLNKLAPIAQ